MTVLSYLKRIADNAVLNDTEKSSIDTSRKTLESRLEYHFDDELFDKFIFGSSTRGTILPRKMDSKSDIDYMVVFSEDSYKPATYLNKLKLFAEKYYSTSLKYQSFPTIALELNHIKFELVPAIKSYYGYQIPSSTSNYSDWVTTAPNDFNQILTRANVNNKSLIKPLVRLVKYWNAKNEYVFESYLLEKRIVEMSFWNCSDLKDYFYTTIENLSLGINDAQWKKDKLNKAKEVVKKTKEYERDSMPYFAESEIKKIIPEL